MVPAEPGILSTRPGPDPATADLRFAVAAAVAHAAAGLDAERARHPGESVAGQLDRVWPDLEPYLDRIAAGVAELAALDREGRR